MSEEQMRVHSQSGKGLIRVLPSVPMELLSEEFAQRNHSQSLKELNSRGGLSIIEMLDNIHKRPLSWKVSESQKHVDELNDIVAKHFNKLQPEQNKYVTLLVGTNDSNDWNKQSVLPTAEEYYSKRLVETEFELDMVECMESYAKLREEHAQKDNEADKNFALELSSAITTSKTIEEVMSKHKEAYIKRFGNHGK